MKKIFKIGFPILCVAVIGGTFILLNKTTEKINRLKLNDDDDLGFEEENTVDDEFYQNEITNNSINNIVNNVVNNNVSNKVVNNTVFEIYNKKISNDIHNN